MEGFNMMHPDVRPGWVRVFRRRSSCNFIGQFVAPALSKGIEGLCCRLLSAFCALLDGRRFSAFMLLVPATVRMAIEINKELRPRIAGVLFPLRKSRAACSPF